MLLICILVVLRVMVVVILRVLLMLLVAIIGIDSVLISCGSRVKVLSWWFRL